LVSPIFLAALARCWPYAVALVAVLGYWTAAWVLGVEGALPLDDSYIHGHFARQLAAGHGLTYNPGEWVAGSTSPLWTALLALAGESLWVLAWSKVLGVGLLLAITFLTMGLARDLGLGTGWTRVAGALIGSTSWLVWSALSGMEILLFAAVVLQVLRLHQAEQRVGGRMLLSIPLAALSVLVRPEGLLLLVVVAGLVLFREGPSGRFRAVAPSVLVVVVPIVILLLWKTGGVLPTTLDAKTAMFAGVERTPWLQTLYVSWGVFFRPLPMAALLATAGAVELVRRRGEAVVLFAVGLPLGYAVLSGGSPLVGNFGRYLFPLLPLIVLLGVFGAAELTAAFAGRGERWRRTSAAVVVVALCVPAIEATWRGASFYARNLRDVSRSDVVAAHWLAQNLSPDALVAAQDVGAIKFYAPQRLIDLSGIVTPRLLSAVRRSMTPADPAGVAGMRAELERERPDYLVVFSNWYPPILSQLEVVTRFDNPDNITMAQASVVVARLPWCRYPRSAPLSLPSGGPES
jgi:arabinofuranosyltransferase